jgi:hypothetical protein
MKALPPRHQDYWIINPKFEIRNPKSETNLKFKSSKFKTNKVAPEVGVFALIICILVI